MINNVVEPNLPKKAQASIPERLFVFDRVVELYGVTKAAIISDLFYWFANNKHPWRTYQNWADWLCVDRKTIARNVQELEKKMGVFTRKRTRMKNGGLGAYKFFPADTDDSNFLLEVYGDLLSNKNATMDLGSFDENSKFKPKYQMMYVSSISELGGINSAYIVNSLAWAAACYYSSDSEVMAYSSYSYLSKRLNIPRTTLMGHLRRLSENGLLISNQNDEGKVQIKLLDLAFEVQENFVNWQENIREKRECGFMDM